MKDENKVRVSVKRTHPWSFVPGGANILMTDDKGKRVLYDKVKDVERYLVCAFINNPTIMTADVTEPDGTIHQVTGHELQKILDDDALNAGMYKKKKQRKIMEESIQSLAVKFVKTKHENDFKALYERLKPGLLQHVYNILKNQAAAEDVIADSFVKMWAKIEQYNPHWNFSTWAYKIAKNEAMQWIRKNGNVYSIESIGGEQIADRIIMSDAMAEDNGIIQNPDWFFDEKEDKTITLYNKVIEEINALPELYRDIMKDRELNGMKYEDISAKYNLEINTVKTRIKRAREKIIKVAVLDEE